MDIEPWGEVTVEHEVEEIIQVLGDGSSGVFREDFEENRGFINALVQWEDKQNAKDLLDDDTANTQYECKPSNEPDKHGSWKQSTYDNSCLGT
jgi:hypothetical protein